jgi:hypothetical protein
MIIHKIVKQKAESLLAIAQGNVLWNEYSRNPSPVRAKSILLLLVPLQGLCFYSHITQGVALCYCRNPFGVFRSDFNS